MVSARVYQTWRSNALQTFSKKAARQGLHSFKCFDLARNQTNGNHTHNPYLPLKRSSATPTAHKTCFSKSSKPGTSQRFLLSLSKQRRWTVKSRRLPFLATCWNRTGPIVHIDILCPKGYSYFLIIPIYTQDGSMLDSRYLLLSGKSFGLFW